MSGKDDYYNRSKQQGYRARSAYKLKQIAAEADLLAPGDTVVDLGAAPGGWLQVAAEEVGESGTVVGVDLQRIDELDEHDVETIRGDMTEERTRHYLREAVGEGGADAVLSDMAPNMTGEYNLDHARSVHLARQALDAADELLAPGGDFVVKVFQGEDLDAFRDDVADSFQYVRTVSPPASRDASSEVYLVAKGYTTSPVAEGDRVEVTIEEEGDEGDGIAYVEGYTLFVDGDVGETLAVEVTDVKPRFGFAEPVDEGGPTASN
ncbi:23S rRNA (uridine(2552)-2'-O)-methyltransferase [Halorubrum distributum]|uniref:Ribosomal RNA large subunit methyltransferase E n=2 Tax=Halorubrum distributum TaxID=29283 RepID=M0DHT4_9EURY|nr:23S rRNA (uridine(2552)-2'-O)-methyltransferase [Halorubrum terrestre]ELZ33749.1 23S rRNA methyltransferase J [Halorubrum terrestre JCM 10247]MYL17620.1 TRAM domain-containing protein [Halorubrum terrestre]MYL68515.1 TRAM domain-containing protein [Halorubrum terrestre]